MKKSKLRGTFSDLEQAIMEIVWKRGKATADQVRQDLEPARTLKESTIRTGSKKKATCDTPFPGERLFIVSDWEG